MSRATSPSFGSKISIKRLRVAFGGMGVLLLGTLGIVVAIAHQRLDEAQKEREAMVASRVFDEMEREVSAFLELENERPNYARLAQTDPEAWAPFVVGYFSGAHALDPSSAQIVVAEGKTSEHRRRVSWALEQGSADFHAGIDPAGGAEPHPHHQLPLSPGAVPTPQQDKRADEVFEQRAIPATKEDNKMPSAAPPPSKHPSDREIIESLNRAPTRRKSIPRAPNESKADDPFDDYMRAY